MKKFIFLIIACFAAIAYAEDGSRGKNGSQRGSEAEYLPTSTAKLACDSSCCYYYYYYY